MASGGLVRASVCVPPRGPAAPLGQSAVSWEDSGPLSLCQCHPPVCTALVGDLPQPSPHAMGSSSCVFDSCLRYDLHSINAPKSVCTSMIFSKFTDLFNSRHSPLRTFPSTQKDPTCLFAVTLHAHPQPRATTHLLSASIDLPCLDISYQWNHAICGLFSSSIDCSSSWFLAGNNLYLWLDSIWPSGRYSCSAHAGCATYLPP